MVWVLSHQTWGSVWVVLNKLSLFGRFEGEKENFDSQKTKGRQKFLLYFFADGRDQFQPSLYDGLSNLEEPVFM